MGVIEARRRILLSAPHPVTTTPASVASFNTDMAGKLKSAKFGFLPVQDLHGYANPWPAGGGKNKLSIDPSIVTKTQDGLTYIVNRNSAGDVTSIVVNGTATARSYFSLGRYNVSGGTILNGCPAGGGFSAYGLAIDGTTISDYGSGSAIESDLTNAWILIVIANGHVCSNLTFKPMIRSSSVSDATFQPYSNICPISGWDGLTVEQAGKNLFDKTGEVTMGYYRDNDGSQIPSSNNTTGYTYPIPVLSDTEYTLSGTLLKEGYGASVYFLDATGGWLSKVPQFYLNAHTFTTPSNCRYVQIQSPVSNTRDDWQLELGSTATPYTPYTGSTYPVSWQSEAGTIYGGYEDLVMGEVVAEWTYALLNDPDKWENDTGSTITYKYNNAFSNRKTFPTSYEGVICTYVPIKDASIYGRWRGAGDGYFGIKLKSGELSLEALKQAASNNEIAIAYLLATPIHYALTPQIIKSLKGANNMWSTGNGNTEITYWVH